MKLSGYIFTFFVFMSLNLFAQGNAAIFDGISGIIEVPEAASYLPEQGITLEAWVLPKNENPGFPDFDGILGLRNNVDCDFYMLQLSTEEIEARFRNSEGQDFTIVGGGFVVNQWNHLAMSYGNDLLTYYLNGEMIDQIPATGICGDLTTSLTIGVTYFSGNDFYFDGLVDEVRLWFTARTDEEIKENYNCQINTPDDFPSLGMYYKLDETTGATTVADSGDTGLTGNVINNVTFTESTVPWKIVDYVNELENHKVTVYPNPSSGAVKIELENMNYSSIEVRNTLGELLATEMLVSRDNGFVLNDLSSGSYIVSVIYNNEAVNKKIIILD